MPEHVLIDANKQVSFWIEFWKVYRYFLLIGFVIFGLYPIFDSNDRDGKSIVRYYKEDFFRKCLPDSIIVLSIMSIALVIIEFIKW